MLAMAARGDARQGDWLVAERQTAGRGRQGREWASPPGNLYASGLVELRPNDPPPPTLALVAGLAVAEVLGMSRVLLKWPNDVLAASAKLAGILLERQNDAVVIGVGVNLAHHPDLPDRPTISLAALGVGVTMSAGTAISVLAPTFARWLGIWRTDGLMAIRAAWLHRAHPIGTPLSAALPDGTRLDGVFDGLTDDCALRLKLPDATTRVIHAGDVFLI
jgi:BirA family transcriptional regulator, biotin operon repressor / biotin---[acetyl-CoA-carboxylase] ligase